jgi:hypothetical protein
LGTTGVAIALAAAAGPLPAADTATPAKVSQPKAALPKPAAPVTAADEELLEFLGGADGELDDDDGDDWLDFLSSTDIRRIAGANK